MDKLSAKTTSIGCKPGVSQPLKHISDYKKETTNQEKKFQYGQVWALPFTSLSPILWLFLSSYPDITPPFILILLAASLCLPLYHGCTPLPFMSLNLTPHFSKISILCPPVKGHLPPCRLSLSYPMMYTPAVFLRLREWSRYLRIFIEKGLRQNPIWKSVINAKIWFTVPDFFQKMCRTLHAMGMCQGDS